MYPLALLVVVLIAINNNINNNVYCAPMTGQVGRMHKTNETGWSWASDHFRFPASLYTSNLISISLFPNTKQRAFVQLRMDAANNDDETRLPPISGNWLPHLFKSKPPGSRGEG